MEAQKYQLHLASKVIFPPELGKDDKPKPDAKPRVTVIHGMSNRAVRYRLLTTDQMNAISKESAQLSGENATGQDIYRLSLMLSLYEMVYEVSDPTDEPQALKKEQWHKTTSTGFQVTGMAGSWSSYFTPKDTVLLQSEYRRWHEMASAEIEMLAGKATPLA